MAYADFEFYTDSYYGDKITAPDFPRLAERATEYLDALTFERLVDGLPTDERAQTKVKKAVCAAAEMLYDIEIAEKVGRSAASTASAAADGTSYGALSSRSAGSESEPAGRRCKGMECGVWRRWKSSYHGPYGLPGGAQVSHRSDG